MNPGVLRLGKQEPRLDVRTFKAARYLEDLAPPPPAADYLRLVSQWPMMANDRLGDCTCAAAGHMIQAWTAAARPPALVLSDNTIVQAYAAVSGYNFNYPATDRGAVELDVLNYWRQNGIADSGHKIVAFAKINVADQNEVRQCISLFGGIYTGFALPLIAQAQTGFVWRTLSRFNPASWGGKAKPGSWGGHAVPIMKYDASGLSCVTWGRVQPMTWAFFAAYCDEAYACVTEDFIRADGRSPSGFDLLALQADLARVR